MNRNDYKRTVGFVVFVTEFYWDVVWRYPLLKLILYLSADALVQFPFRVSSLPPILCFERLASALFA